MKYFFLQPRQTGKTINAIYEFLKDEENSLFVTHNFNNINNITSNYKLSKNNFVTYKNLEQKLIGRRWKNIILDEYLFFDDKIKLYELIKSNLKYCNLFIYSTANKVYNKEIFEFVKEFKKKYNFDEVVDLYNKFIKESTSDIIKEIKELYFNFLTDKDVILISKYKLEADEIYSFNKFVLSEEQFNLEILNQWLK